MGFLFPRRRKPGPVRLCHVTTSDSSLAGLYRGQHRYFVERGYEVWGCSLADTGHHARAEAEGLRFHAVPMSRMFRVGEDLRGLLALYRFFRRMDFDVVEAGTVKAGFLGMLAAWLAGVPVRVMTVRGLGIEQLSGVAYVVIRGIHRWSCRFARHVLAVSHEIRQRCIDARICRPDKIRVVLNGSSNGVDLNRFALTAEMRQAGRDIRHAVNIPDDAAVIGTVARLKISKGTVELLEAYLNLADRWPNLWLLLVGPYEVMQDPIPTRVRETIDQHPRIVHAGYQSEVERYYAAMDIFALPTYREGFCNVLIQAAAMELPVVASATTGCHDPTDNGRTGLLVPVKDVEALTGALERLVGDEALRAALARRGHARAVELYDQEKVWPALDAVYRQWLAARHLPMPDGAPAGGDETTASA